MSGLCLHWSCSSHGSLKYAQPEVCLRCKVLCPVLLRPGFYHVQNFLLHACNDFDQPFLLEKYPKPTGMLLFFLFAHSSYFSPAIMVGCFHRYLELKKLTCQYICKSGDRLIVDKSEHADMLSKRQKEDVGKRQPF